MIRAEGLHKRFGTVVAVDEVAFQLEDGLITGLLGPNGSGKTTTLRMLYTLLRPDRGRVLVDGIDAGREPLAARRRLGVLPDSRGLYPRLTARENIAYFGRLQGLSGATLAGRIEALAEQLDFRDLLDRRCEGFSNGQRTKVALARAFVGDPQNLLLDEPGNGLDVMSNRALREFLRLQRGRGKAILLSTHIMQEVTALCDRILVIAHGRVTAAGTPEELLRQAGSDDLEEAFVRLIGTDEGIMA
jgi:sodium transport system ATP-binding protein